MLCDEAQQSLYEVASTSQVCRPTRPRSPRIRQSVRTNAYSSRLTTAHTLDERCCVRSSRAPPLSRQAARCSPLYIGSRCIICCCRFSLLTSSQNASWAVTARSYKRQVTELPPRISTCRGDSIAYRTTQHGNAPAPQGQLSTVERGSKVGIVCIPVGSGVRR